jgi:copper chaperone
MAQERTLTVEVHGMICDGCVNNVTKAIKSIKEVTKTEVSLEKDRATVWFDSKPQSELQEKIKKAITKAGYLVGDMY